MAIKNSEAAADAAEEAAEQVADMVRDIKDIMSGGSGNSSDSVSGALKKALKDLSKKPAPQQGIKFHQKSLRLLRLTENIFLDHNPKKIGDSKHPNDFKCAINRSRSPLERAQVG